MCLAAYDAELPCGPLKSQTFTVSPADLGDFPLLVKLDSSCPWASSRVMPA